MFDGNLDDPTVRNVLKGAVATLADIPDHPHMATLWDQDSDFGVTIPIWVTGGLSFVGESPTNLYLPMRALSQSPSLMSAMLTFAQTDLEKAPQ